jgi:hypothetical protein
MSNGANTMDMDKICKAITKQRKAKGLFVVYIDQQGKENWRTFASEKAKSDFLHILDVRGNQIKEQ